MILVFHIRLFDTRQGRHWPQPNACPCFVNGAMHFTSDTLYGGLLHDDAGGRPYDGGPSKRTAGHETNVDHDDNALISPPFNNQNSQTDTDGNAAKGCEQH